MRVFFALMLISFFMLPHAKAQETLPGFSASLKSNGKVLISWKNSYPEINQISIQRSTDSLRNFTTLVTVPDPRIPENGFVDGKSTGIKYYYRIFILFPNSKYMFTKSRRASLETGDQPLLTVKAEPAEPVAENPVDIPKAVVITTPVVKPSSKSKDKSTKKQVSSTAKSADTVAVAPKPPDLNPVASIPTETKPAETKPAVVKTADTKTADQKTPDVKTPPAKAVVTKMPDNKLVVTKAPESRPAEEEKYLIFSKIDNSRILYMMETPNIKKPAVGNTGKIKAPTFEIQKILVIKRRDSVIMRLAVTQVRRFSDSLIKQTKDTLLFVNADTLQINPYIEVYKEPKEVYKVSSRVFTAKDGNITISLTDYEHKKYDVAFYEGDSTLVMEIKDIKDANLTIDKTNFGHSGWFRFELYEDGKLKEKNKFLIPRE